ncbi:MAG: hypothetical protein A3H98_05020 [Bacteroidetes bacterium RIFCSPLOWO2_02_FULL_36_8]|nr:MAG: hypothetical protein A3H98_05020 [Bacteroidetes bacterium RIFCSPLOWO2_02_FULL_36_8]OFY70212.1 MAG: hypothetical protein A3G23_08685 [Bacteroidetes bacterium RIFCSPLOWO2_12_FULL_37_12]
MNLADITEGFRKSLVEVLVPEIRQLREDMNERFAKMDERFSKMDERFAKMDEKFDKMMGVLVEIKVDVAELKAKDKMNEWMHRRVERLEIDIEQIKHRLAT